FTLVLLAYKNAAGIGAKGTSACGSQAGAPCSGLLNTTLTMTKTGSLVVGSQTWEIDLNCSTNRITTGNNQTSRGFACGGSDVMGQDGEDNSPASYSNGFPYFYNNLANSNPSNPEDYTLMAIEILPTAFNGINVGISDVDPFCPTSGGDTCHTNFAGKASGTTAANQNLGVGVTFCTGITTSGLLIATNTGTTILLVASYTAAALNATGALLLIQAKLGTTAPSQTFGSGACASGTAIGSSTINMTKSGTLSTSTEFSTAINGACTNAVPCLNAGTLYGWLDITIYNFVGVIKFDQLNLTGSPLKITIFQLK
ncbi:MAG TPA: hypothetical protein VNA15_04575, partial [Candidatus Angelobacter sp.]|nr:hypothetical protein [Candidatus Angelobacter sp.]